MKKLMIVVLLLVTSLAQAQEKEVVKRFKSQVYFDTDKYIIKAKENQKLNSIADTLLKYDDYQIRLYGHTDSVGSLEYNQTLSRNRMLAVQQYLYNKGVDSSQVKFAYFGETRPQVPNSNEQNKARNRRVEITVVIFKPKQQEVKVEHIKDFVIEEKGCPEADTTMVFKEGVELFISGCAFDTIPRSSVCIDFTPIISPQDIDSNELRTEDRRGGSLISFGMYNFCATDCRTGRRITQLKEPITVRVPYQLPINCFNVTQVTMWDVTPGGSFRNTRDIPNLVYDSTLNQYFLEYSFTSVTCQTKNFDCPKDGGGARCCVESTKVSFKVRELAITELYLVHTYTSTINSTDEYRVIRDGKKAVGNVACYDAMEQCAGGKEITIWAKAVDGDGNKYEIKGKNIEDVKARKHFKRCKQKSVRIICRWWFIPICIKWKGTETRKYILKKSDFKPVKESESKPTKTVEN